MQTSDRISYIKSWILDYCKSMLKEPDSLVVGISGGIDSSVTSTICALTGKKTIVLSMPIKQIKEQQDLSLKHQEWLKGKFKNVESHLVILDNVFKSFKNSLSEFDNEHGLANSRARLRMATLYQAAASNNGIVVGTGNKVEDFGVGFYTKYGDGGVDKDLKSRELEINIRKELGVEQRLLTSDEIYDLEPNIKKIYHGGVYYPSARHTRNPRKILLKLFDLFLKRGGKFKKQNVETINFSSNGNPIIKTNLNSYPFDKAVIACGAFSKKLTDQVDEKIPLDTERGYHVHFKGHDHLLSRPVIFLNRGFGITPMDQGLRVVGTVEFGGLDNPLSKKRILNLVNNAKYLFPELSEHCDEWLGFRPSLPDFLPVIGPSKNYKNLFYAFGHHHLGWTLGAITGKIITGMLAEENTNLNLTPYSSLRFS